MLEQCILPVFETDERQSIGGQCFIVGDYLITAAHVIELTNKPYIKMGHDIFLKKEEALAYSYTPMVNRLEDYEDYAIFHLSNAPTSILQFSEMGRDNKLLCNYHRKESQENILINENNIFSFIERSHMIPNTKTCLLTSLAILDAVISPRLFQCKVSPILEKGDSGCPIFTTDNQVLGFLIGAKKENPSIHIFHSATFIKNLIKHE